jgi:hypothetical protein
MIGSKVERRNKWIWQSSEKTAKLGNKSFGSGVILGK